MERENKRKQKIPGLLPIPGNLFKKEKKPVLVNHTLNIKCSFRLKDVAIWAQKIFVKLVYKKMHSSNGLPAAFWVNFCPYKHNTFG
jgi:hypothetical protein